MNLLILSSNNGGGHNSAAKALLEEANRRGVPCTMIDAMLFWSSKRSEDMERIHIGAALHAPSLFSAGNRMALRLERGTKHKSYAQRRAAEHLGQFIRNNAFDTILATQVFSAMLLTETKGSLSENTTTGFVVTDYSYIPFTAMTNLDVYFLPHADLLPVYSRHAEQRIYLPLGIPVSTRFPARNGQQKSGIWAETDSDKKTVLILSGSMGYGDIRRLCRALLRALAGTANVYVMCGRNRRLFRQISALSDSDQSLHAVEYTDRVGEYLDATDVVLSKPGGLSSTEVAATRKPLIFTKPLPGWEEENIRFFTERGMAIAGRTPAELAERTKRLITDDILCARMRERQALHINTNAASDIFDYLLSKRAM